jgi:hypothetical protein
MTKARLIIEDSGVLADVARWTIRVWLVPSPVPPSTHRYKYSLYYGYPGERVVGYDNERGKGDHKHLKGEELPYVFVSIERLLDDFAADVEAVRGEPI